MAEFRKLPTQAELQNMLFMEQMRVKNPQQIAQEALASGTTVSPIPENVFQKIAGGARTAGEYVNRAGTAADLAKLFPGYKPQTRVKIPTGYNFAPKQAPTGEVIPGGLQTQNVNLGQVLGAIKPADVLGISGAERAYSDIGAGKAPQPLDVLDVAGLGATGLIGGKAALRATKGVPVGMSIQEAKGLLTEAPRSPLGFYSALEESALNLQRNKGSGQAFLNDLQKAPNVKADEIKWTGLDEFLKTKPNVTKQEVQDYLANNRVEVQEVRSTVPRLPGEEMPGDKGAFLPKFGQYTLPGGENYREILLTMPNISNDYTRLATQVNNRIDQLADEGINLADLPMTDPRRVEIEGLIEKRNAADVPLNYVSTHFPNQPNILAHLRVNDRVDADGKKMLLVEEVQSDWHQAGRDKGYITPEVRQKQEEINKKLDELYFQKLNLRDEQKAIQSKDKNFMFNQDWLDVDKKLTEIEKQQVKLKDQALSFGSVPDAPMKDTWYQLALKRAIQYAAENGYDRIGLTTGNQQAARFDLSKQVDRIDVESVAEVPNLQFVDIDVAGGQKIALEVENGLVRDGEFAGKRLSDVVGKEMADKISKVAQGETRSLAGDDLRIGGEGMKKYYDEIYPKFLDKYGKKWGARVGETKIQTRSAKEAQEDAGLLAELGVSPDKISTGTMERIRYLDVTPEMKASVSKGQPLFQALPAIPATGLLATQDENR